jgi:hypothetical protein
MEVDGKPLDVKALLAEHSELLEDLAVVRSERDDYRDRCREYEGLLRKIKVKALKDSSPMPMREAVERFLAAPETLKSTGKWREKVQLWLERLARDLGEAKNVHEVEPEEVTECLRRYQTGLANTKSRIIYVCKFMAWATKGAFDTGAVKAGVILPDEDEEWFWLTREETSALIGQLRELHGDYWADAATLQYGCGWRPEELPLLQSSRIHERPDGTSLLSLARIFDDNGNLVRRLKTRKAGDAVMVPSSAKEALRRRLAEKHFLLFPLYDENLIDPKHRKRSQFERSHELWPEADESVFCEPYLQRLREAAAKLVAEQKVDPDRLSPTNIDSRLLRRTCGRELVLKYGFDHAAAVLRDNVDTLRKHYADLLASDVSTDR